MRLQRGQSGDLRSIPSRDPNSRGAAAELMSHTQGEPADQVLDGLHRDGHALNITTEPQLAEAINRAGETRINERAAVHPQARQLAEETEQWQRISVAIASALKAT